MDTIIKSPIEKYPIYFNFSTDLLPSDSLASKTVTCINAATGASSSSSIIDSSTIVDQEVVVVIKAGTEGDEHNIQCSIVSANGSRYQRDLRLAIQSVVTESFSKQPSDVIVFEQDFSRRLEGSDTLASVVGVAIKESDYTDVSATVLPDPDVISPKVGVRAAAGDDGETYLLRIQGTSTAGYVYEKVLRMNVQELP